LGSKFYNSVFNLSLDACICEEEQMAFFPENELSMGSSISVAKGFKPSAQGPVIYLDVISQLDNYLDRVTSNGGEVLLNSTKIEAEGRGWFAWIKDPEGNRIGLYSDKN